MKRTTAFLAAIVFCTIGSVYAMDDLANQGEWPKSWPQELEPLRKHSRTITSGIAASTRYELPFTKREDFESAWPHLLKVKSKGAPLILMRSPSKEDPEPINAGVRVWDPLTGKATRDVPGVSETNVRLRWLSMGFIELVVDGEIVDLNRIPLPAETPIIDKRFDDGNKK